MITLKRVKENPIIVARKENFWESKATFNPGVIYLQGRVHIVYRAFSEDNVSVLGYANSRDGINIDYRFSEPIYTPSEIFEQKLNPKANSGCEDPRLTKIGEKIYMCYTAYDGGVFPRAALSWIRVRDFIDNKWNWSKPVVISPAGVDDKNVSIFSEKVNGKYLIFHRIGVNINYSFCDSLNFTGKNFLKKNNWMLTRKGQWDSEKLGIVASPIKTKEGWIMFYHGVSKDDVYRLGVALLDLKNPLKIIKRADSFVFQPEVSYEKKGLVDNVVFSCGHVVLNDNIFLYYGGADQVIGVATVSLKDLLKYLKNE